MQQKDWSKPPPPTTIQVIPRPPAPPGSVQPTGVDPRVILWYYVIPIGLAILGNVIGQCIVGYHSGSFGFVIYYSVSIILQPLVNKSLRNRNVTATTWTVSATSFFYGLLVGVLPGVVGYYGTVAALGILCAGLVILLLWMRKKRITVK